MQPAKKTPIKLLKLFVSLCFVVLSPSAFQILHPSMVSARHSGCSCFLFTRSFCLCLQDFPLLRLDDVVDDQSNIVGFSMLNISHPFYLEFIRSLNLSWREGCDVSPYPGPAVRRDRVRPRERLTSSTATLSEPLEDILSA